MKNTKIAKTVPLYVGVAIACILLCGIVLFTAGALADQESVPALAYGQTSDGSGVVVYGIGSLDEESLSAAMKALCDLADGQRLVGIISHVAELKSRIDRQIVVKKEQSGGSRLTVVV